MIDTILAENERRKARLAEHYDPLTGEGCFGERGEVRPPGSLLPVRVPVSMLEDPEYPACRTLHEFEMLRMRHDFEYWCVKCVAVKDKTGYADIPLRLNRPQRLIFGVLETMRRNRQPIRAILLKARQCGGSTLIQTYMAWIQLMLRDNWHSMICAHVKDAAAVIKGMMSKIARLYPSEYLPDGMDGLRLRPFEGSRNVSRIEGRGNTVTICSAENQEAARGTDIAMAHLSEVAFWKTSTGHDPNNIIRAIAGSVALVDHTLVVLESTANGVGNFFHDEWLRAKAEMSDKQPIFVPWYEYGIYTKEVSDPAKLWNGMDRYERGLWEKHGLTLEQIAWYHAKRKEYGSHRAMQAEYPTTDTEAFACTDRMVFDEEGVNRLRENVCPAAFTGDISGNAPKGSESLRGVKFTESASGLLKVWKKPAADAGRSRYVTVVDVGGRSESSDYSVIAVIDCRGHGGKPEVAAQWRGHLDHDLLAWKAAQIALWYGRSLLVVESNTLETEATEGDNAGFILEEIADHYPNMYYRQTVDRSTGHKISHPGFHTNRSTKPLVVNRHIATVRDGGYVERDPEAVNEHAAFERRPDGTCGAKDGHHDDILMTRCIGLFVAGELNSRPVPSLEPLCRPKGIFGRNAIRFP